MSDADFDRGMGASCALHPEQGASGTCARCGNFMCDVCSQGGTSPRCPACRERFSAAFPLTRETWSIGGLFAVCWPLFKREWGMLSLGALISIGVSGGAQLMVQVGTGIGSAVGSESVAMVLGGVAFVAQWAVQGLVQLGLMRMCFDVLNGRRADLERLFSQMHKVLPYTLTMLLVTILVLVPMTLLVVLAGMGFLALSGVTTTTPMAEVWRSVSPLLGLLALAVMALLVPLIYVALPLYFLQPELAYEEAPPSPWKVLRRCWDYVRGERLPILGMILIINILLLAGFCLCCVGLVPAMALTQLLIAGMFLALRSPRDEASGPHPG
ncbi:hypothetical protein [Corallococcus silvisoli]|uniref:hypothetical protein n=1 Tax=Corallococcus silvisoli TaxID=2697031 RepID=UPI001376C248|nr:hypothetical protein [Corallococcus silvisoli]NBD09855.1 hypothetical protein [Corallococcus silvisoli]